MIENRVTQLERRLKQIEKRLNDIDEITVLETLAKIEDES